MQVRHIGIVCKNIDESLFFYKDLLGCSVVRDMNEDGFFISTVLNHENVNVRTIKLALPKGETQVELLSFQSPSSFGEPVSIFNHGLSHFALKVDSVNDLYERLKNHQTSFISSPQLSEDRKAKVCFCKDPNGVFLELVEIIE